MSTTPAALNFAPIKSGHSHVCVKRVISSMLMGLRVMMLMNATPIMVDVLKDAGTLSGAMSVFVTVASLNADGLSCDDINECATENGQCDQTCTNTVGGYECTCGEGYLLNGDGRACDDVDECAVTNGGCQQNCTNNVGGFACSCNAGYTLNADGARCDDVNECDVNNGGCDQNCTNADGGFTCSCDSGYSLNADGRTCEDVNECDANNDDYDQNYQPAWWIRVLMHIGYVRNVTGAG